MNTVCEKCGEQCAIVKSDKREGYNSEAFEFFFVSDCCHTGFTEEAKT